MGQISIALQSASPSVNRSAPYAVSDADMARLYAYAADVYPKNADGSAATMAQSLKMFADNIIGDIKAKIQGYEAQKATASIAPISAT